jgi:hypothetical protein
MPLQAGELTEAMLRALEREWQRAKGAALPAAGVEDRRLLFAAVARGLLEYLDAHQDQVIRTIDLDQAGVRTRYQVRALDLDISAP